MFFLISKLSAFFLTPSNLLATLMCAGAILIWTRFYELGKRLLSVGVILLAVLGILPTASLLLLPLTERFPAWTNQDGDPDGIIILGGGGINPQMSVARNTVEVGNSGGRVAAVAELARRYPRARIAISGGSGGLFGSAALEAPLIARLLESFGVARDRIVLEDGSRNTAENALFSRDLIKPKRGERWILVTAAYHMPRAVGCFRRVGFMVEAYSVEWQTPGWIALTSITDLSEGLSRTDLAVHEWLGLIVYRITGRTDALFPGPAITLHRAGSRVVRSHEASSTAASDHEVGRGSSDSGRKVRET
jgi:uncharacterized SAM-binding protein YcdF (DUF218 family)